MSILFFTEYPISANVSGIAYNVLGYSHHADNKTWNEAHHDCLNRGGDLISFHSEDEMNHVIGEDYKEEKVWLGLRRHNVSNQDWYWTDKSPVNWFNWKKDRKDTGKCVVKMSNTYSWNDVSCFKYHDYFCKYSE